MRTAACGLLAFLLVASQAFAEATITYTLELGGNNNREGWKNPPGCNPPFFTSGSTVDGRWLCYSDPVTWAARVSVSGTHSNGFVPSGVANLVFSLELHFGTDTTTGSLVPGSAGAIPAPGQASSARSTTVRRVDAAMGWIRFKRRRFRWLSALMD